MFMDFIALVLKLSISKICRWDGKEEGRERARKLIKSPKGLNLIHSIHFITDIIKGLRRKERPIYVLHCPFSLSTKLLPLRSAAFPKGYP